MTRRLGLLLTLLLPLGPALAEEPRPLPLELPPPDLALLLPLAAPPLDKPAVKPPELPLPDPPHVIPELPAARLPVDFSRLLMAPLSPPGVWPCNPLGTLFGAPGQLFECGRARFQRGELEEARVTLEEVVRVAAERALAGEARYWLGETLLRLGRPEAAERSFLLAAQEGPRGEIVTYATQRLGWIALHLDDPARALRHFEAFWRSPAVATLDPYARHGRARALHGLGRYQEALEAWQALSKLSLPRPLALEITFWLGETLARLGDFKAAVEHLQRFTSAAPAPGIETGSLRLGWWSLAADRPEEAEKAFRWLLASHPQTSEWLWARVGLARVLMARGDWPGAREEIRQLQAGDPAHPLVRPALLLLSRWAVEHGRFEPVHLLHQEMLALELGPGARAYTLLLDGEAYRREGQGAEARSQLGLVRASQPGGPLGWMAGLHLAQLDLEAREFSGAARESASLLSQPLPLDLRAFALLLNAEARYWARDWEGSVESFGRFLVEFPGHPEAGGALVSMGWAELRRGNADAARQRWAEFAGAFPADPRVPEALLLTAELAGQVDEAVAMELLEQFLSRYPGYAQADVAVLNRAILRLRAGRSREAREEFETLVGRGPAFLFLGRARLALGASLLALRGLDEGAREFKQALEQGEGALAHLGAASVALSLRHWEEAARGFQEARDLGTARIARAAEYGLAAVALNEGRRDEFRGAGASLLQAPPSASVVPALLYVLGGLEAEGRNWSEARKLTFQLVSQHPVSRFADHGLFRLASSASAGGEWSVAREAFQLIEERYPRSPFAEAARLGLSEALLRSGAPADARRRLEASVTAPGDPRLPRALFLLAEAREASGARPAAIEAYARFVREYPNTEGAMVARVAQGRLLQQEGRWEEAREPLERALLAPDLVTAGEAAYRLGEGLRARRAYEEAAEAYMTAVYLAPGSVWAQRALLGAGQSFQALKQTESAGIVLRKLLTLPDVEAELARQAQAALGATPGGEPR
jgi:TolA-binding protein